MLFFYQYKLVGKEIVPCNVREYNDWIKDPKTTTLIKKTYIKEVEVSTHFLGINHGDSHNKPILFETKIFVKGNPQHKLQSIRTRYTSYKKALEGHKEQCKRVKSYLEKVDPNL